MFNSPGCLAVLAKRATRPKPAGPTIRAAHSEIPSGYPLALLCKKKSKHQHTEYLSARMFFFRQGNVMRMPSHRIASRLSWIHMLRKIAGSVTVQEIRPGNDNRSLQGRALSALQIAKAATYSSLFPLALLLFTGLYMFMLSHAAT